MLRESHFELGRHLNEALLSKGKLVEALDGLKASDAPDAVRIKKYDASRAQYANERSHGLTGALGRIEGRITIAVSLPLEGVRSFV